MGKSTQDKMFSTRAELIGVKPKVLAARVRKRLNSVRAQVEGIGAAFEDVNMLVVDEGERLVAAFDAFEKTVNEAVAYLNEGPG